MFAVTQSLSVTSRWPIANCRTTANVLVALSESSLAALVLNLAIQFATPGASPYSLKLMPECGTDRLAPKCEIKPLCSEPKLACRPPHWSRARNSWVRAESAAEAERRYTMIANVLADTASRLVACEGQSCDNFVWSGSTKQLALAALTVVVHESGLREDIQFGRGPLGRGSLGEACLMQLDARDAPYLATWIPEQQRQGIAYDKLKREQFAQSLLGDSPEALSRCFEVGMRMLARARASCSASSSWQHGMFSMYGTGTTCNAGVLRNRSRTFERMQAASRRPLRG